MSGMKREPGMTFIVKVVTRLTLGFILLFGFYITFCGHKSPGGGFAGGVIIALSLVHIVLAFGLDAGTKRLKSDLLPVWIGLGALGFLWSILPKGPLKSMGQFKASMNFFASDIVMPLCEAIIVGCGLFAIFIALITFTRQSGYGKEGGQKKEAL